MSISNLTGKPLESVELSKVSDRLFEYTYQHKFKLLVKETSLITCDLPQLNKIIKAFQLKLCH